jgi:hypothetical protein
MLLFNFLLALQQTELILPRVAEAPVIDGLIDEAEWRGALLLNNWVQTKPGDNTTPEGRTSAWLFYDGSNLYIAIRAWDDRARVRYRMTERDAVAMQGQDWVNIHLDTFNDRRRAFAIAVNPLGFQGDWIEVEGSTSSEWDGTFDSSGELLEDGWSIEVRIPFATLRYPGLAEQSWGLSLARMYGRADMQDSPWNRNRDLACNLCQMATLTGIRDIERSRSVEINPTLVARGASIRPDLPEPFSKATGEMEPGGNIKVGLSQGLTFDGTINPDFSQIEADAGQLALNSRFALFFPEKRDFFLESGDVFQVKIPLQGQDPGFWQPPTSLIYTRRIVDPTLGAKLSGKAGPMRLGVIAALDAFAGYEWDDTIGGIPAGPDPGPATARSRSRARLWTCSPMDTSVPPELGARWRRMELDRRRNPDALWRQPHPAGVARRVRPARPTWPAAYSRLSGLLSESAARRDDSLPSGAEENGERRSGETVQTQLTFQNRYWTISAAYTDVTAGYETRLGFTPRTDLLQGSGYIAWTWRGTGWLQEFKPGLYVDRGFAHKNDRIGSAGERTDQTVRSTLDLTFGAGMYGGIGYTQAYVRFDGTEFPGIDHDYVYLGGRPANALSFDFFTSFGEDVIYSNVVDDQGALPGSYIRMSASVGLRPLPPVRLDLSVAASRIWRRNAETSKESLYGESAIPRAVLRTQFTRRFGVRLIGEYRIDRFHARDGSLYDGRDDGVRHSPRSVVSEPERAPGVDAGRGGERGV